MPSSKKALRSKTLKAPEEAPSATKQSVYDLQNAMPYLLARAGMRMGQAFTKQLRQFELTLTEWRVCATLHHRPHQRLSTLAAGTSTEPSTLSRVVEALMQRGLLIRDRSEEDGRAVALSLTPAGVALTERVIPLAQIYERVAMTGFTPAQADAMRDLLRRIYDNMTPLDPEP